MKILSPLTADASEAASTAIDKGMKQTSEWTGYIVTNLKQIPEWFGQNPNAAVTVIAVINIATFFILNAAIHYLEKYWGDESKEKERTYAHIALNETLAAGMVLSLNLLLSKATKAQFDYVTLTAITLTHLVLRVIYNHVYDKEEKPVHKEVEVQKTPPLSPKIAKEENTPELKILLPNSPEKAPVQASLNGVEMAELKAKLARETARADKLQGEKSEITANIADIDANIAKLQTKIDELNSEKKEAQAQTLKFQEEVESLEHEKNELKADKESLQEKLAGAKQSLKESEASMNKVEEELATLKKEIDKEKAKSKDVVEQLKKEKAKADDALSKATDDAATTKKTLDDKIVALKNEKKQIEDGKQKVEQEKKKALDDLNALKDEKETVDKELTEARKAADKATDEAKQANKEKERMEKEKKTAYDAKDGLEIVRDALKQERDALKQERDDLLKKVPNDIAPEQKHKVVTDKVEDAAEDVHESAPVAKDPLPPPTTLPPPPAVVHAQPKTPRPTRTASAGSGSPLVTDASDFLSGSSAAKKGARKPAAGHPPRMSSFSTPGSKAPATGAAPKGAAASAHPGAKEKAKK